MAFIAKARPARSTRLQSIRLGRACAYWRVRRIAFALLLGCGVGTRLEGGFCIPDGPEEARYEVRVSASEVSADGYSKFRVFAIGALADGSPSTEPVVFGVSRTGAGNFAAPSCVVYEAP